jgi:nucleotide-binding universal stress UspA family protein
MKKILVAVDFSECSMNAFRHAVDLAKKLSADLTMVWVNPETFKFISPSDNPEAETKKAREAFEGIWQQYHGDLPHNELKYIIKRGQVYEQIVKTAIEESAEVIVSGTHGVSGFREFWMGSNAFRLIMASTLPVLTIREQTPLSDHLRRIVLPIDSTIETRQKTEMAADLAEVFDAQIHVLSLFSTSVEDIRKLVESYSKDTIKYLKNRGVNYLLAEKEGSNITNMTLEYAREVEANLIVIMTEQEIKTSNLWMGTYARQMINHSEFPVLSIKPKAFIESMQA